MQSFSNMANVNTKVQLNARVTAALEHLLSTQFNNQKYVYEICDATGKGENYIGIVYRVVAIVNGRRHQLIVKVPPENLARRKQFFVRPCFLRESLAYERFLPLAKCFQNERAINEADSFHEHPEYYLSLVDDMNEAIFIEDMTLKGFRLFDRFVDLTSDHVELVMKTYAKLHAISFAIRDQQPNKLQEFRHMRDIFHQRKNDQQLRVYFESLKKKTLECLNSDQDSKYIDALNKYFDRGTFMDLFLHMINGMDCEPFSVVCHGDCWNNNILYRTENGTAKEVCLLDWQLMRYASPITDIMYYLFVCTTKHLRDEHYQRILDTYFGALHLHLLKLKSNPQQLFPYSAFAHELKTKGAVGLLFAMMVLPVVMMTAEETPNLETLSELIQSPSPSYDKLQEVILLGNNPKSVFSTRMRDVVIDMVDLGYI